MREHRAQVDAVVRPERAVLCRDDRVLHTLGDLIERDHFSVAQPEGVHDRTVGPVDRGALRERARSFLTSGTVYRCAVTSSTVPGMKAARHAPTAIPPITIVNTNVASTRPA